MRARAPALAQATRPAKMVSGLECEQTNVFLQHLAVAAGGGRDSRPAVDAVLARMQAKEQMNDAAEGPEEGGDAAVTAIEIT